MSGTENTSESRQTLINHAMAYTVCDFMVTIRKVAEVEVCGLRDVNVLQFGHTSRTNMNCSSNFLVSKICVLVTTITFYTDLLTDMNEVCTRVPISGKEQSGQAIIK